MKVAYFLTENINPEGSSGASAHVRENIKALKDIGHEVTLVRDRLNQINGAATRSGLRIFSSIVPSFVKELNRDRQRKQQSRALIRANEGIIAESDVVYARDAYQDFEIVRACEKYKKPFVLECNGIFWMNDPFCKPLFPNRYKLRHLEKWGKASHLIVISDSFKKYAVKEGIKKDCITAIQNGVDVKRHMAVQALDVSLFKQRKGIDPGKKVLGFLGHMLPWHGVDLLLEAFCQLIEQGLDVHGLMVGGGLWEKFQQTANELGLENSITFTGPIQPEEVPIAVAAMDVAVLPGSNWYNSPVKLFDYGAAKKPVVAADYESVCEVIDDGKTGLLFSKGSVNELADRLRMLIHDEVLATELGNAIHESILARHTWQYVARKTSDILEAVAESCYATQ